MIKIAPSILSADFAHLGDQVLAAEQAGASMLHIDVMDGRFVPNLTMGPLVVEALRKVTSLPLDVHLMVEEPSRHLASFASAGASIITVHAEACPHLHRDIESIRATGVGAGVALNPGTPIDNLTEVLSIIDLLLVMAVDPGYGGQAFIMSMVPKIEHASRLLRSTGGKTELSVDGGIKATTAPLAASAGATILVAGSAVFGHPQGISAGIKALQDSLGALN
jgi:ribulose-phosphate 3-epimerase